MARKYKRSNNKILKEAIITPARKRYDKVVITEIR